MVKYTMVKYKVQEKLQKEYENLETQCRWLNIRRKILGACILILLAGGYMASIDAFAVLLIFIGIPFGIVYYSNGRKLSRIRMRIDELEKMFMSGDKE